MSRTRPLLALAIAALVAGIPGVALAQWSTGSVGAAGYAAAVSMPTGEKPTVSSSGSDITVSWPQAVFPDGTAVSGYVVARYATTSGLEQTVGAGCAGTIGALSCVEMNVPSGQWKYAVTPVHHAWIGTEGPWSATVPIMSSSDLTLSPTSVTTLPATLSGSISGFVSGETVTFRLDDAVSGTLLSGSISPSPVPGGGGASASVTIPGGTTQGAHTVYAVGSLGTTAAKGITVADTTPPSVGGAVIAKASGGTPGFIAQGGAYYVYANVTDAGDPSSGVSSATADVSTVTAGQTAVPLVAGSYTIGGVSYGYRSASLTAANPLGAGATAFTVSASDGAGNPNTQGGFSVTVDNTVPSATDVQTTNGVAGVAGKAETGDSITFTFSEPIEPGSVLAGWTGPSTSVTLQLLNQKAGEGDRVQVWNAGAQLPLGTVGLGRNDYTAGTVTFMGSTMTMTGNSITVVLGTPSPGAVGTVSTTSTMQWTPDATPTDRAGNVCSPAVASESGAADVEF